MLRHPTGCPCACFVWWWFYCATHCNESCLQLLSFEKEIDRISVVRFRLHAAASSDPFLYEVLRQGCWMQKRQDAKEVEVGMWVMLLGEKFPKSHNLQLVNSGYIFFRCPMDNGWIKWRKVWRRKKLGDDINWYVKVGQVFFSQNDWPKMVWGMYTWQNRW